MEYLDIKKLVMAWLLIALIIIIAEAKAAQDRNQTHLTCNKTQVLRQGKDGEDICCHSAKCKLGETFLLCSENNGSDICSPCGDEYFTALSVDTALVHIQFDPCMKLKCPDGAMYTNGSCICDISNGYYGNDSSKCMQKNCTRGFLLTLNGHCRLCENQDNCTKLIIKRQSSEFLYYGIVVGTVLLALATFGTALGRHMYRRRKMLHRGEPFLDENDPLYSEPYEVGRSVKRIEFEDPYSGSIFNEEEGKQQAQPLNPRPVVVDGNTLHQESSLSSALNINDYPTYETSYDGDSTNEFQIPHAYIDSANNNDVDMPQAAATINEFQPGQITIDKRQRLPSPIEPSFSDDHLDEINDATYPCYPPNIISSNPCDKILNVDFLNEHVHTDKRRRQPSPIESSFSDDQVDVINMSTGETYPPRMIRSNPYDKVPKVDFLNDHLHTGRRRRQPSPIESSFSDDQFGEINDASYPPHIIRSNPYHKVPKVDVLNDHLHTEENQYFSHFLPIAGNVTGNDISFEVEKHCSEEDNSILYERYHCKVDAHGNTNDEYGSEVVCNKAERANISYNLPYKSRSLTNIDDVEVQFQSNNEEYSEVMSFEKASSKKSSACTDLVQIQKDKDLPLKHEESRYHTLSEEDKVTYHDQCVPPSELVNTREEKNTASQISQEDKLKDQCVPPCELVNTREEKSTASRINQEDKPKDQCVRPKEFGKTLEKKKTASQKNQEYKFNTAISESRTGITITPNIHTIIQKVRSREVERRNMEELIEHLQCANDQQRQTIERLQQDLQEWNIIKQQYLPELARLLGIDPPTDKSEAVTENDRPPIVPRRRNIGYTGLLGYTSMDYTSVRKITK